MDKRVGDFKLGLDEVAFQQRERLVPRHPVQRLVEEVS